MHFRKAVITDIPTIQQIAEETWRPTYGHILTEEQTLYMLDMMYAEEVLRKQIEGNVDFFMVEESEVAVGYFAIEQMEEKHAKLHKIYLSSKKKSAGIGSAIIQFLKNWGLERGIQTIELNVNKYNSAVTFYEKMGFERLREMVLDIGQGYVMDDYVMQLRLLPIR
jgi:N-acetylglutamate synthase-like GNAT family acetyltransferase